MFSLGAMIGKTLVSQAIPNRKIKLRKNKHGGTHPFLLFFSPPTRNVSERGATEEEKDDVKEGGRGGGRARASDHAQHGTAQHGARAPRRSVLEEGKQKRKLLEARLFCLSQDRMRDARPTEARKMRRGGTEETKE
jgi:hypothetical protein